MDTLFYAKFLPGMPYTWRPGAPYLERFLLLESLAEITPGHAGS